MIEPIIKLDGNINFFIVNNNLILQKTINNTTNYYHTTYDENELKDEKHVKNSSIVYNKNDDYYMFILNGLKVIYLKKIEEKKLIEIISELTIL